MGPPPETVAYAISSRGAAHEAKVSAPTIRSSRTTLQHMHHTFTMCDCDPITSCKPSGDAGVRCVCTREPVWRGGTRSRVVEQHGVVCLEGPPECLHTQHLANFSLAPTLQQPSFRGHPRRMTAAAATAKRVCTCNRDAVQRAWASHDRRDKCACAPG
jgi:hypothetical protein